MRATASNDTILDRTFIPDDQVVLVCPAGFAGAGPFHVALFAWALLGFGASTRGSPSGRSTRPWPCVHQRNSIALTRSMAYHPGVQHQIAEMRIALEGCTPISTGCATTGRTVSITAMSGRSRSSPASTTVVNQAWAVVDTAFDLSGGAGIFKRSRFEQLFRDARLGRIHPGNSLLTHELVGKMSLGINPDEQPRWG